MLRTALKETLANELKRGLKAAISKQASSLNPDGSVTLASLKTQLAGISRQLDLTQERLDLARTAISTMGKMLDNGSEISTSFIDTAVDTYIESAI